MDLNFTEQELAFRAEIREWVAQNLPQDISHKVHNALRLSREDHQRWARILGTKGWLGWNWPKAFGGPGWNAVERHLFEEELALAGAPRVVPFGPVMVAPVIMAFGSPEQQQRWLPSLLHKAMLVVEELVVNVLTYGGQQRNTGMVQIQLQEQADQLCIDIYDNGAAFDPLSLAEPDVDADLDSRGVGGLGHSGGRPDRLRG